MISAESNYSSPSYRRFVLCMLLLVYMLNYLDRQLLVILQESIKAELGFSDAQLGLMSGFAFALLYVSFGIPIARWADRSNRRNIIALSLTVWSVMTALCGLATNFVQMLLARMGVAIGEAGGSPPALSMISDIFPPERRATAMSVFSSGIYFGFIVGFILGGWLGHTYGWRTAFLVLGLPGVLLSIFLLAAVREPERGAFSSAEIIEGESQTQSFADMLHSLWNTKTFRYVAIAAGFANFASYGVGNWLPSYLLREFSISMAQVGLWMGIASGLGGLLGTLGGGLLVDKLVKRDPRWYVWVPLSSFVVALILGPLLLVLGNFHLVITLIGLLTFAFSAWLPASLALSHSLVSPYSRAQATAVLYFVINIIGMGFGPLTAGLISDFVALPNGGDSLRVAMMAVLVIGAGTSIVCFYQSGKTLRAEIQTS